MIEAKKTKISNIPSIILVGILFVSIISFILAYFKVFFSPNLPVSPISLYWVIWTPVVFLTITYAFLSIKRNLILASILIGVIFCAAISTLMLIGPVINLITEVDCYDIKKSTFTVQYYCTCTSATIESQEKYACEFNGLKIIPFVQKQ
ncbi:MAG: hypothetical protein J0M22_12790 [Gammaproteobacteria bacterium]|nr:hypothetical protein [Gammaproteobacteria bacterium]